MTKWGFWACESGFLPMIENEFEAEIAISLWNSQG